MQLQWNQWNSPVVQILFALFLAILPITITEIPVIWKCVLWVVSWAILLHFGYAFVPAIGKLSIVVKSALAVGVTAFLVAGTYTSILKMWKKEKAAALSGDLSTPSDGKDHSGEPPQLQIGNAQTFKFPNSDAILRSLTDEVKLRRIGNSLLFSATVKDKEGNLVVEIVDNHWTVSSAKSSCWDKNYTDDSLEVKDGRGRVVLQIKLLPDKAQIQIEWPEHSNTIIQQEMYDERNGIRPRFKYPSENHWGELEANSGYEN